MKRPRGQRAAGPAVFDKSIRRGTGEWVLVKFRRGMVGRGGNGTLRSFCSKSFSNNVAVTGHMGRERKQVPWRGCHPSLGKAPGCEKTTVPALQGRLWFLG